jgi:hypothetical protein
MTSAWGESLSQRRFGRLLVISEGERMNGRRRWSCVCDCGAMAVVEQRALKSGASQSCGCFKKEVNAARLHRHGASKKGSRTRLYKIWGGMLARCRTPSATGFDRYGGSGVVVCDRWLTFENFLADMGEPPPGMSIDRIDSTAGYGPGNCRWATRQTQNENRRSVRWIEFNGVTLCAAQWADRLGISKATLYAALKKHPIAYALRPRGNAVEATK